MKTAGYCVKLQARRLGAIARRSIVRPIRCQGSVRFPCGSTRKGTPSFSHSGQTRSERDGCDTGHTKFSQAVALDVCTALHILIGAGASLSAGLTSVPQNSCNRCANWRARQVSHTLAASGASRGVNWRPADAATSRSEWRARPAFVPTRNVGAPQALPRHRAVARVRSSASEGDGAPGRSRTCDPRLRRPVLYPLSYGRVRSDHYTTRDRRQKQSAHDSGFRCCRIYDR